MEQSCWNSRKSHGVTVEHMMVEEWNRDVGSVKHRMVEKWNNHGETTNSKQVQHPIVEQ